MSSKKEYIHYLIALIIGLVLAFALQPTNGLTEIGVRVIAILIPILYLWLTTNTHWTSLLALALLALDQWVKRYIALTLPLGETRPLLPGLVELKTVHNYGAAWSSFSGARWLLVAATSCIVLALLALLVPPPLTELPGPPERTAPLDPPEPPAPTPQLPQPSPPTPKGLPSTCLPIPVLRFLCRMPRSCPQILPPTRRTPCFR